jgi:uncharacterized protein YhdP
VLPKPRSFASSRPISALTGSTRQTAAAQRGQVTASTLELAALASLAGYLPLDAGSRQLLVDYAPRGRISQLRAAWVGDAEALQSYSLKAGFDELAVQAKDSLPGVSGLSGVLDASEKGGSATLRAQKASVNLPSVLPDSPIRLGKLDAQARWKITRACSMPSCCALNFPGRMRPVRQRALIAMHG